MTGEICCLFYRSTRAQRTAVIFRNAVQVNNIGQTQVGHVPRQVASKLAPLLDRRLINVEGVIHDGNRKIMTV
jgi:hypothetical protein